MQEGRRERGAGKGERRNEAGVQGRDNDGRTHAHCRLLRPLATNHRADHEAATVQLYGLVAKLPKSLGRIQKITPGGEGNVPRTARRAADDGPEQGRASSHVNFQIRAPAWDASRQAPLQASPPPSWRQLPKTSEGVRPLRRGCRRAPRGCQASWARALSGDGPCAPPQKHAKQQQS